MPIIFEVLKKKTLINLCIKSVKYFKIHDFIIIMRFRVFSRSNIEPSNVKFMYISCTYKLLSSAFFVYLMRQQLRCINVMLSIFLLF